VEDSGVVEDDGMGNYDLKQNGRVWVWEDSERSLEGESSRRFSPLWGESDL